MTINTPQTATRLLHIDSSAKQEGSVSRLLAHELIAAIDQKYGGIIVDTKDVNTGIPHINSEWVSANTTASEERASAQKSELALSDELVQQLAKADVLVINIPVYNFGIPSTLKAWLDHICRAGITFRYTSNGPVGLLQNKQALLVYATGGTKIGSDIEFASPYMRQVLGFVGIHDVSEIAADQLGSNRDAAIEEARHAIWRIVNQAA